MFRAFFCSFCHPELLPEPVVAEHRRSIEGQNLVTDAEINSA